jgi:hypothetical protein
VNPILAAPAAVLGAVAVAPGIADLARAPADFLSTLRKAVGSEQSPPLPPAEPSLERRLQTALESLHRRLQVRLAAAGIDTTAPFSAELNSRDRIHVLGEHPQADKIRGLFADDTELTQAAREIRQLAEALGKSDSRRLVLSYTPQRLIV